MQSRPADDRSPRNRARLMSGADSIANRVRSAPVSCCATCPMTNASTPSARALPRHAERQAGDDPRSVAALRAPDGATRDRGRPLAASAECRRRRRPRLPRGLPRRSSGRPPSARGCRSDRARDPKSPRSRPAQKRLPRTAFRSVRLPPAFPARCAARSRPAGRHDGERRAGAGSAPRALVDKRRHRRSFCSPRPGPRPPRARSEDRASGRRLRRYDGANPRGRTGWRTWSASLPRADTSKSATR